MRLKFFFFLAYSNKASTDTFIAQQGLNLNTKSKIKVVAKVTLGIFMLNVSQLVYTQNIGLP